MSNTNEEESLAVSFDVQFWGVRDKIATPGENTIKYGGNTCCVEMRLGDQRLIFDSGTGIRKLGNSLLSQMPVDAHVFFTHCHWDRIQGFPFFIPAFIPINHFHIYGASASNGSPFKKRLSKQMLGPNFPVPIQVMQSKIEFYDLDHIEKQVIGEKEEILVENKILNDVHRSIGYRINYQGKTVVYAMTGDYYQGNANMNFLQLAKGADLLLLASPTSQLEGMNGLKKGVGSIEEEICWQNLLKIGKEIEVKQIGISLHSPEHTDEYLDKMEEKIKKVFPTSFLAKEGMVIPIL